jgi:CubicO group peptidase (beta-lactamase class C family)
LEFFLSLWSGGVRKVANAISRLRSFRLFVLLALLVFDTPAFAAAQSIVPPQQDTAAKPTLAKTDVDAWLDGYMPYALASGNVAGAVVVVVKDGRVLTERGYGYSDVATKRPMDPLTTFVRPASTSKLFTWTAVMQQVQAGRIDLDHDVNDYLDFKIPPYQGKPITMRNLMTHTAGFEERIEGLLVKGNKVPSLSDTVKAWIPERIFAPGTTPAYSNYGATLAGYIVERVSGEPYDEYIARHIFQPLGMTHSTMSEPLPANLMPFMSKGYKTATEPPVPFEMTAMRPAGSATATASDMARFMLANLDEATNPLLKPAIAHEMHTTALTIVPPLNRMDLGFYEHNIDGVHIIAHGGDTDVFHSYLWLIPAQKTGVFFSMNSRGEGDASETIREGLIDNFVKRYFSQQALASLAFKPRPQDATAVAGDYIASRRGESNFTRLFGYLDQTTVTVDDNGNIQIAGDLFSGLSGKPRNWTEIAPFVWRDRVGNERFAAQLKDGEAVRIATDSWSPFMVFDRVPWYETQGWLQTNMLLSIVALLSLILSLPFGALARHYYRGVKRIEGNERRAYLSSVWSDAATIVVACTWVFLILNLDYSRLPAWVYLLQVGSIVAPLLLCVTSGWLLWMGFVSKRAFFNLALRAFLVLVSLWVLWFAVAFRFAHIGLNY